MGRINTNVPSLRAYRQLTTNQSGLATSLQRLSSGLRINRGADDPAGLIASENLRSEIVGLSQAIDNTQRADTVLSTAEGALAEVSSLLLQLQNLTVQTANEGGLTPDEVAANQLQADSILASIDRIAGTTRFAGEKLLDGSRAYATSGTAASALADVRVHAALLGDAGRQPLAVDVKVLRAATAGRVAYAGAAVASAFTIEISGVDGVDALAFNAGVSAGAVARAVNDVAAFTGVSATASAGGVGFSSTTFGSSGFVSVRTLAGTFLNAEARGENAAVNVNGTNASADGKVAGVRAGGLDVSFELADGLNVAGRTARFFVTGGGSRFQLGEQVNASGQMDLALDSVATGHLGASNVGWLSSLGSGGANALSGGNLTDAQRVLDSAIRHVSRTRGRLGAVQKNTLQTNLNSLAVAMENVTASNSAIRDTDFASETAAMTRLQILVDATQSVLAQANAAPQRVLALLGR